MPASSSSLRALLVATLVLCSACDGDGSTSGRDGGSPGRLDGATVDGGGIDAASIDAPIAVDGELRDDGGLAASPTCTPQSGARLRLRRLEGGGASIAIGFHDAELDTDCEIVPVGGVHRCLPTSPGGTEVFFTDAACTSAIGMPSAPVEVGGYVVKHTSSPEGCAGAYEIFGVTGTTTLTGAETIYSRESGSCARADATAGAYVTLGPALASDAFAELDLVSATPDPDHRIELRVYQGADGSRLCTAQLFDRDLDIGCDLESATDGTTRCLPESVTARRVDLPQRDYSDPACSAPLTLVTTTALCGAPPATEGYVTVYDFSATCRATVATHVLGAPIDTPVYTGTPSSCTERALAPDTRRFMVGAETAPASFARASEHEVDTGGRLRRIEQQIEDGPRLERDEFYDTELDTRCFFFRAIDGTERCLPDWTPPVPVASVRTAFTDASCTVEVEVAHTLGPCTDAPRYARQAVDIAITTYRVIGPYDGALYGFDGPDCVALETAAHYFELGAEIPPSEMVEGTRRTE
jgi:hypothetical protein